MGRMGAVIGLNQTEQHVVELVRKFQAGDTEAYDRIYSLTYSKTYYWIYSMVRNEYEAQDVAQEAYLTVYQNLAKLQDPQAFKKWFNQVVLHCTLDYIGSKRFKSTEGSDIDAIAESEIEGEVFSDAGQEILDAERKNAVLKAVNELNPDLRATVLLRYYNDCKEREISEIMMVPLGTVKRRLMIAKQQLSGKLTGIYSVFPFFFVRMAAQRQARFVLKKKGLKTAEKPVRKAAVCFGAAAGAAAAVVLTGPEIQDIRCYSPGTYVNEQKLEWNVSSKLPLKKVEVEGLRGAADAEGNHYRAVIRENGTYIITAYDINGRKDSQTVVIENIDSQPPIYQSYTENSGSMILRFHDTESGINWSNSSFKKENGQAAETEIDPSAGLVRIALSDFPVQAKMEDLAGNYGYYDLNLHQIHTLQSTDAGERTENAAEE